ncbi:DUF11 domain-containing protein [Burkholderia sp. BCC0405]|uniref:beta strand repeat-containing protein n=1 Tax=Burkholderia sp. BCC0405 TaxID=2676298 RepID=UPI001589DFD4|nr:DUF11 domain-containing protein [Burkholderia sp. BCC0405]
MAGSSGAYAAAPPANTLIGNQASAAYVDPNGIAQTATSNLVQTQVQQVGSFNLDSYTTVTTNVVNTKTGAAGAVLYAPHVLTNTGNGTDTFNITVTLPGPNGTGAFSKVEVYADPTFSGLPGSTTPLCSVTPNSTCTVPAQTVAGNNGQFGFVVAYYLPSTATTPTTPYGSATVNAVPGTPALYTAPNTAAADVDNVNLTTVAAFNLTKTIAQPQSGVTAPGGGAWPTANNSGQRSSSASCPTTWSAGLTSTSNCQYTVYTLTYSNTGGASGTFSMADVIGSGATAGLTYVSGSAVWSNAPGTALAESNGATLQQGGVYFSATNGSLAFVDQNLPVNTTRSLSFVVLINSTAALGSSTTTNTAYYDPTTVPPGTTATPPSTPGTPPGTPTGTPPSPSNPPPYTVTGTYSIVLGSTSGSISTSKDTTPGTPNGSSAAGPDTTVVASAAAGAHVAFTQTIWNTGNATDQVLITGVSTGTGGGAVFPAGTTFSYYKADGSTPLANTGNGPVTDPIQAGGSTQIVVKANLPTTLLPAAGPLNYTLTVTGTSVGDSTKIDSTRDVLNAVTGVLVDLTNTAAGTTGASGDLGTGPSTQPTTINTVPAGSATVFSLFVANNDTVGNSYSLAASATASFPGTLPAGWNVKFVAGNVSAASCASATAITTVSVAAGTQTQLTACVTPPATQAPVTAQPIYFQVRSTAVASTGSIVVDTKYDAVTVTTAALTYSATLTPNNVGQVAPGGSVVYAHTLTNTGTGSCTGPYTYTATLPAADVTAGWTTALYLDVNGNGQLDAGDTLITGPISGPLAANSTQQILVKVFAPGGATAGASDTATVTATFPANSCGAPNATDLTTVITGQIRVVKTQALVQACDRLTLVGSFTANTLTAKPGDCIVYQVVATNQGTAPVSNLSINDAIPAYTTLNGMQPTSSLLCSSTGISPALTGSNFTSSSTSVSCGSTANTVQPGGSATLMFVVKVNQ